MESTTQSNPSNDHTFDYGFHSKTVGRNYGIGLGVITALYLIVINFFSGGEELSLGFRFAKHLLIIPVVWMAIAAYASYFSESNIFKGEFMLLLRIAGWSAITLSLINVLVYGITSSSFEQFMQEGNTLFGAMMNSGFLLFETFVFVMIIGFVILQAYKRKGSPED